MKIKTSEAKDRVLDYLVAKCEGLKVKVMSGVCYDAELLDMQVDGDTRIIYSTDWAQGGPIIEREGMTIAFDAFGWEARHYDGETEPWVFIGDTALVAAMRCYVASKLGDEVEVPDELEAA